MYSSGDVTTVRTRYDPLQYGLKAIRYRVKHFGHSTQWRRKEDIDACVTIDRPIEQSWTFADSAPDRLDIFGRRSRYGL
jgi:hypothetical protein